MPSYTKSPKKTGRKPSHTGGNADSTPPALLNGLKNRHYVYYSATKKYKIPFSPFLDLSKKSCLSENYNPDSVNYHNIHMGQRKLLLSEIQLLTEYYKQYKADPVVLYIGAAAGSHLVCLHRFFPRVKFILYDGSAFDPILKRYPEVFELHSGDEGFFTNEKCHEIKDSFNRNLVFVSDIRSTIVDFEPGVERDLVSQQEWVKILRPKLSLLKFRFPYDYTGDTYKYLKGQIYLGIWSPSLSGETRLLVSINDKFAAVDYDVKQYEKLMFFHNKYKRQYAFEDALPKFKGIIQNPDNKYCLCFDCIAELTALSEYSAVVKSNITSAINTIAYFMNPIKKPVFLRRSVRLDNRPLVPLDDLLAGRCSELPRVE